MSNAQKAIPTPRPVRRFSPEACKNIGDSKRGKKLSSEHCRRIAEGNRGKKRTPEFCKWLSERPCKPMSEETKQKIKATRKRQPVVATASDGTTTVYPSIRDAAAHGHNRTSIWRCLKGLKETYHDMTWGLYA
jgi:hypothetical protein